MLKLNKHIKSFCIALCAVFFFVQAGWAVEVPKTLSEIQKTANEEIEDNYGRTDYLTDKNANGKPIKLHILTVKGLTSNVIAYGEPYGTVGSNGELRYLGEDVNGVPFSNIKFPIEVWGREYIEDYNWIKEPWKDNGVKKQYGFLDKGNPFLYKPEFKQSIIKGLLLEEYQGKSIAGPNVANIDWHEYVYVYQPPTTYTWGMGRMWNRSGGRIYYKTVCMPPLGLEFPDFYPTGETSYTGNPGEPVNVQVILHNSGAEALTNFGASWWGSGWSNPLILEQVTLNKGESQIFNLTVNVPQPGEENRLVFKANIDGKTPENELNQYNNILVVNVKPRSVDLAIKGEPIAGYNRVLPIDENYKIAAHVNYRITRKDGGTEPIQAVVTMYGPAGTQSETITIGQKRTTATYYFSTCTPGTYTYSAEVWPVDLTDANPGDNKTSLSVKFTRKVPKKKDTDSGIIVGLGG